MTAPVYPAPLTTAEISELLKVQPKKLRAFLRSNPAGLPQHLTPVGSGGRYKFTSNDIPTLLLLLAVPTPSSAATKASADLACTTPIPNPLKDKKAMAQVHQSSRERALRLQEMMAPLHKKRPARELVSA